MNKLVIGIAVGFTCLIMLFSVTEVKPKSINEVIDSKCNSQQLEDKTLCKLRLQDEYFASQKVHLQ